MGCKEKGQGGVIGILEDFWGGWINLAKCSVRMMLVRTPINVWYGIWLVHLLESGKVSSGTTVLYSAALLAKGVLLTSPNKQYQNRAEALSLQTESGNHYCWEQSAHSSLKGRGHAGACMVPSPLHSMPFGSGSYSGDYEKRKLTTNPSIKPLPIICPACNMCCGNDGTKFVGVANKYPIQFENTPWEGVYVWYHLEREKLEIW